MMQIQKIKAQVHMLVGATPIAVQYETDAGAEQQWKTITGMLKTKKPGDFVVVTHEGGSVWIDLMCLNVVTWTKEQRVSTPMHPGLAAPGPGMRMS